MTTTLFPPMLPPTFDRWRIEVADVAAVCASVRGASMVHADPPWSYDNAAVSGNAVDHYTTISIADIVAHLDAAYDSAAADCYLVCWCTWPKLGEWMAASSAMRWRYVTGGAWHNVGRMGIGFHVRGDTEPVLVYVKGSPRPLEAMSNGHASERGEHSEKPVGFLRSMVRAFSPPDGLVLDLYAGRAPLARACAAEGRRYIGAEIDPERAGLARAALVPWAKRGAA